MIVFNGMDFIVLAIGAGLLVICGLILAVDRISRTVKKRIEKAHKEEGE